MQKGFTLIEIVIVTLIVAMLSVLLMRTYVTMTRIAFRVQQEKNVTEQAIMMTQIVQNLADTMTIDYEKYGEQFGEDFLANNNGITPILFLTGDGQTATIQSTGDCVSQVVVMTGTGCAVSLQQGGQAPIILTQSNKATMTTLQFKIIPYASQQQYIANPALCATNLGACLYQPGFWMLTQMHTPYVDQTWESNIIVPIQAFFTLKR